VRQARQEHISTSGHNGANSEADMTTRKPKPTFPSEIELPAERLRLATVTVEPKTSARYARNSRVKLRPASRSLPARGKITLH
jgi:hypothetical protein